MARRKYAIVVSFAAIALFGALFGHSRLPTEVVGPRFQIKEGPIRTVARRSRGRGQGLQAHQRREKKCNNDKKMFHQASILK
jgi:hypothetical protein